MTEKTLHEFETNSLLKPAGITEDKTAFYTQGSVEQVVMLKSLMNLGYALPEIQKIVKKVGLPNNSIIQHEEKKMEQFITISSLAEQVGVSPRTIKHWEEKGIIESELRSAGGFRLYSQIYVYMCKLIKDLQLFNYSLEEIKTISDYFRDFLLISNNINHYPQNETEERLEAMNSAIIQLFSKMNMLKEGIARWESLLKTKQKEIKGIKTKNTKSKKSKIKNQGRVIGLL
ncbi:MAG: MerR family transcriptional regulator [Ignavibacteriales bacterium]|nr:MerR family transcriptional regulator [Ignavibacteriales bacterium]